MTEPQQQRILKIFYLYLTSIECHALCLTYHGHCPKQSTSPSGTLCSCNHNRREKNVFPSAIL